MTPCGLPSTSFQISNPSSESLRLAGSCTSLNKRELVNAMKEANWKMLQPKLRARKASRKRKSTSSGTTASGSLSTESKDRIRQAVQVAYQAKGLGSTMVDIREEVAQHTGIVCNHGAAMMVCDKALLKLLRKRQRLAQKRPTCPVPKFAPKAIYEQEAARFREQAAMKVADSESCAWRDCTAPAGAAAAQAPGTVQSQRAEHLNAGTGAQA